MKWICPNRYGVPSGMRVEYLRIWLMEDKEKETPNAMNCLMLVKLVHTAFRDSLIAE